MAMAVLVLVVVRVRVGKWLRRLPADQVPVWTWRPCWRRSPVAELLIA
jgi:hypothetical protein